ncbi:MAG: glycosyltransferase family 4 protein [Chlorobium sp.]|nr:MAG: glycosyltransferase family 4 protein [Chlorobium sp.]
MKILVNASTLVIGGGIQIGLSFIQESLRITSVDWIYLVSPGIYSNLDHRLQSDCRVILIKDSPAKLLKGYASRKKLYSICKKIKPSIVYSIGFPSYILFNEIEIGRYTNPWEINSPPLPWDTIKNPLSKIITKAGIKYRLLWARKANFIETQTETAKKGIIRNTGIEPERVFVIPNNPNKVFIENGLKERFELLYEKKGNIAFCLSAPYAHKNLELIPEVAYWLCNKFNKRVSFILTLPKDSELWRNIEKEAERLNVNNLVTNVGVLKVNECIEYYKKSKIVFLPTLLEVFSATYLEAMAMKVPIVTTDLEFAHDNCKDAAIYYEPRNSKDAALKIRTLLDDRYLYEEKVRKGVKILNSYPTIEEKFTLLLQTFIKITADV